MAMDFNDVALFVRVVESGSFSAAAGALGIQKSSVTRGVARLERELGVRLLQRSTHSRDLTAAGRALYERVRESVSTLRTAADAVAELDHDASGVVRVACPPVLAHYELVEGVADFTRAHPKIHVELVLTHRNVDLIAEQVDLAVRAGELPDSTLVSRRVGRATLGVFASAAYLAAHGAPETVDALADHPCVLTTPARDGHARWPLVSRSGETRAVRVHGPVSADEAGFVISLVSGGLGLGMLPLGIGAQLGLQRVLPSWTGGDLDVHLVMPTARMVPTRVVKVRDWLEGHITHALGQ